MILRNVGRVLLGYRHYIPENNAFHSNVRASNPTAKIRRYHEIILGGRSLFK
jgi:hypothetical protein